MKHSIENLLMNLTFPEHLCTKPDIVMTELKGQCHEIFHLYLFSQDNSIWSPDKPPIIFKHFVSNSPIYSSLKFDSLLYNIAGSHKQILRQESFQNIDFIDLWYYNSPMADFLYDCLFKSQESFSKCSDLTCCYNM